ncbi:hypothetical protein DRF59_19055 [Chryseobacterium flavum]|uniref:Uncharacterized protein n=1 Tax=Chryseobacterium flavum TaxID=415851 RepID=A0A3D9CGD1_9FLAO|nr:hypothetical protein DRF59_19055 [Chryseobacterium flavum]
MSKKAGSLLIEGQLFYLTLCTNTYNNFRKICTYIMRSGAKSMIRACHFSLLKQKQDAGKTPNILFPMESSGIKIQHNPESDYLFSYNPLDLSIA